MKILKVTYHAPIGHNDKEWREIEKTACPLNPTVNVGFLIAEDKESITLAAEIDKISQGYARMSMTIYRKSIIKIETLRAK